ncbi:MAG: protein kinase [Gammaproteobacteria bacterium]|nr:protein kinase [Gammaproteobacteria bacterium]
MNNPVSNSKKDSSLKSGNSEKPPLKPLDIIVPAEIGRYTIGAKIGSGTCGVVHLALDNVLNREVAIKLSPIGEPQVSTGKVPGAQRAYQTEVVAAGRLRHSNIVTVYDAGQYEELNYLVMEAVEGKSLKEFGKGKELLPVHRAIEIIIDTCRALDYSHRQDILHRDIKPANIMLGDDGSVKLLDYGIAVGLTGTAGLGKQGPTLGTPNYMSPEQIMGRELTPASDFYSLATVLFELLTGKQLFKAGKVKDLFRIVVNQPAPRLTDARKDLPEELADVLAKALEKKPELRFQSGIEMAAALQPFAESFKIIEQRPPAQQKFIRQLQTQTFFQAFSEVEVALLLELVKVRTYEVDEILLPPSEPPLRSLLIVTDGLVRVTDNDDLIRVCGEGDCVGELGFIQGTADSKTFTALTSVNALEVSADSLSHLPPKVHLHYYRAISDILVERSARSGRLQLDHTL